MKKGQICQIGSKEKEPNKPTKSQENHNRDPEYPPRKRRIKAAYYTTETGLSGSTMKIKKAKNFERKKGMEIDHEKHPIAKRER